MRSKEKNSVWNKRKVMLYHNVNVTACEKSRAAFFNTPNIAVRGFYFYVEVVFARFKHSKKFYLKYKNYVYMYTRFILYNCLYYSKNKCIIY